MLKHDRTTTWRRAKPVRDARSRYPEHKSGFRADGTLIDGRAKRSMDRHPVQRDGDAVVVDVACRLGADQDQRAWNAAVVQLAAK